jgi:[ribosomal protein S5]-alanine N-acetyltransferase
VSVSFSVSETRLIPIQRNWQQTFGVADVALVKAILESTFSMYCRVGSTAPWIGYLCLRDDDCAGACAFKSRPIKNRVEIAYFTFPGNECQGVGTSMAQALVEIAQMARPDIILTAETKPDNAASARILTRPGFCVTKENTDPHEGLLLHWELGGDCDYELVPS